MLISRIASFSVLSRRTLRMTRLPSCISLQQVFNPPQERAIPPMVVNLTESEDQLCRLLDECRKHLLESGQDVECRIAGGWVRDKLLGTDSNDIDIALSSMMGVPFAEKLVEYMASKEMATRSIAKIASNPQQSKHLETARTIVLGMEIDFVNLRSEEYAEDSRIPTGVKFGQPLEDAERRDITINTLFYNVHSRTVEDHTGKGLNDLKNGIIRTPLEPRRTFVDDPLRVLRCIRFASRFGFQMKQELEDAARDEQIQTAIAAKISKERIGEELHKMIKGPNPLLSIRLIDKLSLFASLFAIPPPVLCTFSGAIAPFDLSVTSCEIMHGLLFSPDTLGLPALHPLYMSQLTMDKTLRSRLFLASALTPFKGLTYLEKKKERPAVEAAIRESLKLGNQNHYLDGIPALFASAEMLKGLSLDAYPEPNQRSKLGMLLRDRPIHYENSGSHWTSSLLFSLSQELIPLYDASNDSFAVEPAVERVEAYNRFMRRIEELGLQDSIPAKPLLDGWEVCAALEKNKSGPWMMPVMNQVIAWQFDNPTGTKEECVAWLKAEQAAGRINTANSRQDKERSSKKAKKD